MYSLRSSDTNVFCMERTQKSGYLVCYQFSFWFYFAFVYFCVIIFTLVRMTTNNFFFYWSLVLLPSLFWGIFFSVPLFIRSVSLFPFVKQFDTIYHFGIVFFACRIYLMGLKVNDFSLKCVAILLHLSLSHYFALSSSHLFAEFCLLVSVFFFSWKSAFVKLSLSQNVYDALFCRQIIVAIGWLSGRVCLGIKSHISHHKKQQQPKEKLQNSKWKKQNENGLLSVYPLRHVLFSMPRNWVKANTQCWRKTNTYRIASTKISRHQQFFCCDDDAIVSASRHHRRDGRYHICSHKFPSTLSQLLEISASCCCLCCFSRHFALVFIFFFVSYAVHLFLFTMTLRASISSTNKTKKIESLCVRVYHAYVKFVRENFRKTGTTKTIREKKIW